MTPCTQNRCASRLRYVLTHRVFLFFTSRPARERRKRRSRKPGNEGVEPSPSVLETDILPHELVSFSLSLPLNFFRFFVFEGGKRSKERKECISFVFWISFLLNLQLNGQSARLISVRLGVQVSSGSFFFFVFFLLSSSSSGQDVAFSWREHGFDPRRGQISLKVYLTYRALLRQYSAFLGSILDFG